MKSKRLSEHNAGRPALNAIDDPLHARIHALVLAARQTVARGLDLVQVRTCFEIGCHIVEHEQRGQDRAVYGQAMLKGLAERLTQAFGRGFAKSDLEYIGRLPGADANQTAAKAGGGIANRARLQLEAQTCRRVVSGENYLAPPAKKRAKLLRRT